MELCLHTNQPKLNVKTNLFITNFIRLFKQLSAQNKEKRKKKNN